MPRPTPLYFGPESSRSFGWLHEGGKRGVGLVLCPPLGYDAVLAHRPLRHLAEQLAATGHDVVRLDYHGTGDADGIDEQPDRVPSWIASIEQAADELRALGCTRVALYGLRAGALLAAATRADLLVLHAAPASGKLLVRELKAFHRLASASGLDDGTTRALDENAVEAAGFVLWSETVTALQAIDLAKLAAAPAPNVLVISREDQGGDDKWIAHLDSLGAKVQRATPGDYVSMMQDPHKSLVPDAAWRAVIDWLALHEAPRGERGARSSSNTIEVAAPTITEERVTVSGAPSVRETPLRYGPDDRLFGILAEPIASAANMVPIVLLNSGSVHRVGPNRMHVLWSRAWAAKGHRVLRLDIGGIGDSEVAAGALENQTYSQSAVADVEAALAALARNGAQASVLIGLCSGAYVAFHTSRVAELRGALLINPQTFDYRPGDPLDVGAARSASQATYYKRVITSTDKWKKLLRGEVDVLRVANVVMNRSREVLSTRARNLVQRFTRRNDPADGPLGDELRRVANKTRLGFVFSEGDPGLDYLARNADQTMTQLRTDSAIDYYTVARADHTFTPPASQRKLFALLSTWLEQFR